MKVLLLGLSLLTLLSCSGEDLSDGYAPLTEAEVTEALKDARIRSVSSARTTYSMKRVFGSLD